MSRTREFDPTAALDQAMHVFWKKGYADTSVDDLVEATGVSRYGLYGTFGSKRTLFGTVLERYRSTVGPKMQSRLRRPGASLAAIVGYFEDLKQFARAPEGRRGCLVCNTCTELGASDAEASAQVRQFLDEARDWMRQALANARQKREIAADTDIDNLARFLVTQQMGLAVQVRAGESAATLEGAIEATLSVLESAR